jgi:hypothetical protein
VPVACDIALYSVAGLGEGRVLAGASAVRRGAETVTVTLAGGAHRVPVQVAVHYSCLVISTDEILDTTYRPGEPVVSVLGSG